MAEQEGQQQGGFSGIPGAPSKTINFPLNTGFIVFEVFETLNTKPTRPAIKDSEMYWCDGWMPFGPSNLRTLYGIGSSIYSAPSGRTINAFWFFNFSDTTYVAVILTDGSLQQVNTVSMVITQIMPPGTISSPDPHNTSTAQWNGGINEYLVIVSVQTNGYWLWDGTNLFTAGTISPDVTITAAGQNYTSPPTVTFYSTNGAAVAPTFLPVVTNGFVTSVGVTSPGSGFAVDDFVMVSFSGGGSDNAAVITPNIAATSGPIINIIVLNGGMSYLSSATVAIIGPTNGASLVTTWNDGVITGVTVITGGSGFTTPPALTVINGGGSGNGFVGQVIIGTGSITSATINSGGTNYKSPPALTIIGDGQGAQLEAVINNTGAVTSVVVKAVGYGYTKALIQVSGGNNAAEAAVILMPFGVQGTTVDTYENRIWVGNVRKGYFTAPASASDFSPSDGAGAFESTDSFQRVAYHSFKQTNGFLYLISDSSINYIGGVQTSSATSSTGVTSTETIFSNLNVDPQIGTPWPSTVQLFSRNIVMANSFGIFVSYGGAVAKISAPLDGIYNTVVTSSSGNPLAFPSSAVASIFGIQVYMLLFPIIDPYTNLQVNKLLLWDGKRWFTSNQDSTLTYVASQEINSILTAWGSDGTRLFPLFQNPTTGFQKVVQSKLWSNPSFWFNKTAPELSGLINFNSAAGTVNITVDNEQGSNQGITVIAEASNALTWFNNIGQVITWTNNSSQELSWGAPGLAVIGPQTVGQAGVLMGMTAVTSAADVTLLSLALLEQNYQFRG